MIETLWNNFVGPIWNLAARIKDIQPRILIIIAVTLLVCARGLREFYLLHTGHRDEIAIAIGSVGSLYGTPRPESSSSVLYLQSSEKGIGLFRSDVTTGRKQAIAERPIFDYFDGVSPFSPDGSLFAWVFESIYPTGRFSVCRSDSGIEVAQIHAPEWHVSNIVWLTPQKFVCRGWVPGGSSFHLIQKQADEQWNSWTPDLIVSNFSGLAALSSNIFAWADNRGIRALNTVSNSVTTLFESKDKRIAEFCYSQERCQFLVTCKEKADYSLWRLTLNTNAEKDFKKLGSDIDIRNAQWVNGGHGYAYLNQNTLIVKTDSGGQSVPLADAVVEKFITTPDGRQIFFFGTATNEPWSGLWQYDIATQSLTNVVPYSDSPSRYAIRACLKTNV